MVRERWTKWIRDAFAYAERSDEPPRSTTSDGTDSSRTALPDPASQVDPPRCQCMQISLFVSHIRNRVDWKNRETFIDSKYKDNFIWSTHDHAGDDLIPDEAGLTADKHKVLLLEDTSLPSRGPFRKIPGRTLGTVHSTNVYKVGAPLEVSHFKQFLALKVIKCQIRSRDVEDRKVALREVKNMMPVDHLHIVVYVASFEQMLVGREPREVKIDGRKTIVVKDVVLEYNLGIAMYPAGICDLSEYMDRDKITDERRHQMFRFFGCLSQAVSYLHSQKIRLKHKDIKPANIIVDSFNQPLLTDFGISKHYRAGEASKSDGWTYKTDKYACPQSTDETERDYRSDVYSLGCVFLEMATVILRPPESLLELETFRGATNNKPPYCETLQKVDEWLNMLAATQDAEDAIPISILVPALEHIRKMLSLELNDRPWADQLWDYFKGLYIYNERGIMDGIDEKSGGISCKPCVRCDAQSKKTRLEGPVRRILLGGIGPGQATEFFEKKGDVSDFQRDEDEIVMPRTRATLNRGDGKPVWIEWKSYDLTADDKIPDESERRTAALAELLSIPKPADFCTPQCLGFLDGRTWCLGNFYGWVFELPVGTDEDVGPVSLFELLEKGGKTPSLSSRVKMAEKLASCVLYMHTVNWLHKGIRSDNVLFLPSSTKASNTPAPETTSTTKRSDPKLKWDIYRWPSIQRAELAERNSRKTYDIYSLGLVLLEIAHWKPLYSILKLGKWPSVSLADSKAVRERVMKEPEHIQEASDALGERYAGAVRRCVKIFGEDGLGVREDVDVDETSPGVAVRLQGRFIEGVVEELKEIDV